MNVKLFFETHGRFPSQHEFRLLKESADPDAVSAAATPAEEMTPAERFVEAARQGKLDVLKQLHASVPRIDEPARGITALAAAAQANHLHCVEWLLDNGADVDRRTPHGRSPLLYAAESGHFELMNVLITRGAMNFTYTDQQLESYFVSYAIRQAITRRDVQSVLQSEPVTACVLEYLGLGGLRVRPIERLTAHVMPKPHKKPVKTGAGAGAGAGGAAPAASPSAAAAAAAAAAAGAGAGNPMVSSGVAQPMPDPTDEEPLEDAAPPADGEEEAPAAADKMEGN